MVKMGMAAADAQFHVLAVDDSLIDRKLIERLLKTSSFEGNTFFFLRFLDFLKEFEQWALVFLDFFFCLKKE